MGRPAVADIAKNGSIYQPSGFPNPVTAGQQGCINDLRRG
jgi:hypothetical protein